MLDRTFSRLNTLGHLLGLRKVISLTDIFKLRRQPRYRPGVINTRLGEVEYVDATSLLSGLHEIFVDEIYRLETDDSQPLVVIDCGANIGLSAIYFATTLGARVHAYEADPEIATVLRRNVESLCPAGRVEVEQRAVWIDDGGVTFDVEGAYSGQIHKHGHELVKNSITVPSIRLRDLIDDVEGANFLKLDIEGAENEVLLDCAGGLDKLDYLFIEWHSVKLDQQYLGEILNLLKDAGFRYHLQEAFTSPHPFVRRNEMCGMDLQLNVFAFR